jgi:hypothetical protein
MTKTKSQKLHCKSRFVERYGIKLSKKQTRIIKSQINDKNRVGYGAQSFTKKYQVRLDNKDFVVVYDQRRKTIVTVLTQK